MDDYDNGGQKSVLYKEADIAFSPALVGSATLNFIPAKKIEISLLNKYVSKQYLDNTQQESRKLDAFFVNDLRGIYTFKGKKIKELSIIAQLNNLFNVKYEPNGYTFSYIYGGQTVTENFYFPMAGMNFMLGVNLRM
ncbi:MAG: TonB-dependent receptor [Chitinophagaceae bacterium]|nr:TonB-dependent receptor [Chitinophagaceae bacterium]